MIDLHPISLSLFAKMVCIRFDKIMDNYINFDLLALALVSLLSSSVCLENRVKYYVRKYILKATICLESNVWLSSLIAEINIEMIEHVSCEYLGFQLYSSKLESRAFDPKLYPGFCFIALMLVIEFGWFYIDSKLYIL